MVATPETSAQTTQTQESQQGFSTQRIMQDVKSGFAEVSEYAKYLLALEMDRVKLMGKKFGLLAALGVVGLMVLSNVLAVGVGLLLLGIAGLLGRLFDNFWLGATIVGFLITVLPIIGGYVGWKMVTSKAMKALRLKYADKRERQRHMFGQDVKGAARG